MRIVSVTSVCMNNRQTIEQCDDVSILYNRIIKIDLQKIRYTDMQINRQADRDKLTKKHKFYVCEAQKT